MVHPRTRAEWHGKECVGGWVGRGLGEVQVTKGHRQ